MFIAGDAGLGKTTLVDRFIAHVAAHTACWWARGECVEAHGAGEAYLPVLDAVGQLCRGPAQGRVLAGLHQRAPTWLVQLPWLLSAAERENMQRQLHTASRERMLREMAALLEALTAEMPVVLVLEDLHWSDSATVDLMAWLARQREPARLMLIGTYRPVEVIVRHHPLREVTHDLRWHRHCQELRLEMLAEGDVASYLRARFHDRPLSSEAIQRLAHAIYQRTDGHPFFMVTLVDYAVQHGWFPASDGGWDVPAATAAIAHQVPESLRQMIAQQVAHLHPEERSVLEAASVVGVECPAAAVAAGTAVDVEVVEQWCEALARRGQFLLANGLETWPDGTVAGHYRFRHALQQQVIYERLSATQRMRLHRRVGERQEAGYRERASERATELAQHFEQARDYERAVHYLGQAAEQALRRYAYQEASRHLRRAVALLQTLPDTLERAQQELSLQIALGRALIAAKGYGAPDVAHAYTRARELCRQVGDTPQLFTALWGLRIFSFTRAELPTARELGEQLFRLAQRLQAPALLLEAHRALGQTLFFLGEVAAARVHMEQAVVLYDPQQHRVQAFLYGSADPQVVCLSYAAWALWTLGSPEQALHRSQEALALGRELAHPPSLVAALHYAAFLHAFRREAPVVQAQVEALMRLSEPELPFWLAMGTFLQGWALAAQGQCTDGLELMHQGLAARRAMGTEVARPLQLAMMAEAYGHAGQPAAGLTLLAEALAAMHRTGERWWEAELYRLKGELLLARSLNHAAEADTCFRQALDVARRQHAKSLELRAALSLSRLWQRQGKRAEAQALLAPIYAWFTEGFETTDFQEARALLEALA